MAQNQVNLCGKEFGNIWTRKISPSMKNGLVSCCIVVFHGALLSDFLIKAHYNDAYSAKNAHIYFGVPFPGFCVRYLMLKPD